jgi:hypothetical protein
MGLSVSHGCWVGAYSAFHVWRCMVARVAGLPPLDLMEGFYTSLDSGGLPTLYSGVRGDGVTDSLKRVDAHLPIRWSCLKPSALIALLDHSDSDGIIEWARCSDLADALQALVPLMPPGGNGGHVQSWADKTQTFVDGLRWAFAEQEDVEFD